MRSNYNEKKEARIDRYKKLSDKNKLASDSFYKNSSGILSFIPLGQPILVGHHSERRHRSDLSKADNYMRKSIEADKKADYYTDKAIAAEHNTSISSDNANALQLLRDKLAKLEQHQTHMKEINALCRKKNAVELLKDKGYSDALINEWMNPKYSYESKGYQRYELSNNNATINSTKKRIQQLEKLENTADKEYIIGEVRIVECASENRTQIFFPSKPSTDCITDLKRNGFRWAPTVGAWMRHFSSWANRIAQEIVIKHYQTEYN